MAYFSPTAENSPLILTVPGINNSGPDHWQTHWERHLDDCRRIDLGLWDKPHRNTWVNKINLALHHARRPVILVAHSLGCHAVAWWAALVQPAYQNPVVGALLVAPPEVDTEPFDERFRGFSPSPLGILPFPSFVVASRNDPYISFERAQRLAKLWGSNFSDAGYAGHINADSDIGDWSFGQLLLRQLQRQQPSTPHSDTAAFAPTAPAEAGLLAT